MKTDKFFIMPRIPENLLKNSKAHEIKTLICLEQCRPNTLSELADYAGISVEHTRDALKIWLDAGILSPEDLPRDAAEQTYDAFRQYDIKTLEKSLVSNDGLKFLVQLTEQKLARPLQSSEISILFGAYDWLKLPVDVIYMLVCQIADRNVHNFKYLEKVALDWAKQGIKSVADAQRCIDEQKEKQSYGAFVKRVLGISGREFTPSEKKYAYGWQEKGIDEKTLLDAYERTVKNTGKVAFAYINKILMSDSDKKNTRQSGFAAPQKRRERPGNIGIESELDEARQINKLYLEKISREEV